MKNEYTTGPRLWLGSYGLRLQKPLMGDLCYITLNTLSAKKQQKKNDF